MSYYEQSDFKRLVKEANHETNKEIISAIKKDIILAILVGYLFTIVVLVFLVH